MVRLSPLVLQLIGHRPALLLQVLVRIAHAHSVRVTILQLILLWLYELVELKSITSSHMLGYFLSWIRLFDLLGSVMLILSLSVHFVFSTLCLPRVLGVLMLTKKFLELCFRYFDLRVADILSFELNWPLRRHGSIHQLILDFTENLHGSAVLIG